MHPEATTGAEIDQIISYCLTCWGGRLHAIFPCDGEDIPSAWWKALVWHDPDVVYSFTPLNENLVRRINRHILPTSIFAITPEDRVRFGEDHPIHAYEIGCLGIEDLPAHLWARRGWLRQPTFVYFKDSQPKSASLPFILRNFGTLPPTVSIDSAFRETPVEVIDSHAVTPHQALERLISIGAGAITPIDLCAMLAQPTHPLEYSQFARGFHLVIGDSPYDALYAWNRALAAPEGVGRASFWLPASLSQDADLINLLGTWITRTFWGNNYRQGKVVSYSLPADPLRQIADTISTAAHLPFQPCPLEVQAFPFPNAHPGRRRTASHVEQLALVDSKALMTVPRPPFLIAEHPDFGWMVDVDIQYHPDRFTYTNLRPNWRLPKRLDIAASFFPGARSCRIVTGGLPSRAVMSTERTATVQIPSDHLVVWHCLGPRHANYEPRSQVLKRRFNTLYPSDKGRYLLGLIQLFGNLFSCDSIFGDLFWENTLLFMAGALDETLPSRSKTMKALLMAFLADNPTPMTTDDPRLTDLAEFLARRISLRVPPLHDLTKKQLRSRFGQLRRDAILEQRDLDWWNAYTRFDDLRDREFEYLVETGVLLQGVRLRCPRCGSAGWHPVGELQPQMRCSGCFSSFPLKPDPVWTYRVNDLARNALRFHGTLAVLRALIALERRSREHFLFLPCQDVYEDGKEEPFTDLDLVAFVDGRFVIGEVKSDPAGFAGSDFETMEDVAGEIRRDEVVFAAPGDDWPPQVSDLIAATAQKLVALDVTVTRLPLSRPMVASAPGPARKPRRNS